MRVWTIWPYLAVLGLVRLGLSLALGRAGLSALSDDDYARMVIAETFATAPRFDPSQTSWLPFPFWVMGGTMAVFGRSLEVARVVTDALAVGGTWLLFAGARVLGMGRGQAFLAALLGTACAPAAILGRMSVPEFPTAALSAFALMAAGAAIRTEKEEAFLLGAPWGSGVRRRRDLTSWWLALAMLAMFAATLSRYEAWPVAVVVGAVAFSRRRWLAPLALLGPLLWFVDNRVAHGDALHFLRRVASYRAALGDAGAVSAGGYFGALLVGCPSVLLPLGAAVLEARRATPPVEVLAHRWWPSAAAGAALLVFLAAGAALGGAPTHHPERALLLIWLVGAVAAVDLASRAWLFRMQDPRGMYSPRVCALGLGALLFLLGLDLYRHLQDLGANRQLELEVGTRLRALVPTGERVLVATDDYGYFAIMAAFGRPSDIAVDRTHDPRVAVPPSSLATEEATLSRLAAERATWIVAPDPWQPPSPLIPAFRAPKFVVCTLAP
jgi:hypothetical protein